MSSAKEDEGTNEKSRNLSTDSAPVKFDPTLIKKNLPRFTAQEKTLNK